MSGNHSEAHPDLLAKEAALGVKSEVTYVVARLFGCLEISPNPHHFVLPYLLVDLANAAHDFITLRLQELDALRPDKAASVTELPILDEVFPWGDLTLFRFTFEELSVQ